jgi:anti-sigma factor RsiW
MNGHVRQELLALYLRGDLPVKDYRRVARHVDHCPECQATLADFTRSYELLTSGLEEPEQADLMAVRSAVMLKIPKRRLGPGRWIWASVSAAVLMVVVLLAWHTERQELPALARLPRPGPPAVILPPAPPLAPSTVRVAGAPRKRVEPEMRAATLVTEAGEPACLKMNTSDPNVVILWQLQENEKVATP